MVSLFAFIHFCGLLSSVSASLSIKLNSFPEAKQFVSSANSFIIMLSSELLNIVNK